MMKLSIWFGILALSLLFGIAYSVNGAALQISSHTTIPDTIYPGTAGQLQLTLLNSGSDSAAGVKVSYKTPSQDYYSETSVGDIGAGSTAIASIPFTVPSNVGSGFFTVDVNVVYFSDQTNQVVKNTPATIPIIVGQHQILAVRTLGIEPQAIQPGDSVTAQLELVNTGGVMNNVVITTPETSSFSIEGVTEQPVGSIPFNSTHAVSLRLTSSSSAASGKYTIPIIVKYQDALQNTVNQTVYAGPVTVTESSGQFRIYMTPITPAEVGSEAQFGLTVENMADSSAAPIIDINQTTQFTPIGTTRIYFDDIAPGTNQTKIVTLGIGASISAGYYSIPLEITNNGNTYIENIGIVVNATPDVVVTTDTQPEFISSGSSGVKVLAQISNNGNSAIRSVYIYAQPQKQIPITGATDKFVGTLNVDDFATFQMTINVPPNLPAGQYQLPIVLVFKDAKNIQHTLNKNVTITVYSAQDAARFNIAGGQTDTTAGAAAARTRANGGGLFGIGWLQLIIGAVVVLVIGYFGYKRWKGSKK
jgi:hypothetical protein